jgi:hypothetical protein
LGDLFFCLRVKMLVLALQFSRGVRDQFSPKVAGESEVPGALAATATLATAGSSALPWGDTDTPASRRTDGAGVRDVLPQNGTVTLRSFGIRWCLSPFPKGSWEKSAGVGLIRSSN